MNRIGLRASALEHSDHWLGSDMPDVFDLMSLGGGEPRYSRHTGIKALMVALLDDAIQCYLSPSGRMRAEAECWITNTSQRAVFSFCVVCETLGLDPAAVRTAIQRLQRPDGTRRRAIPRSRPNARRSGAWELDPAPG
jgi:hypothetical protein